MLVDWQLILFQALILIALELRAFATIVSLKLIHVDRNIYIDIPVCSLKRLGWPALVQRLCSISVRVFVWQ